jgi:hypothetical protein
MTAVERFNLTWLANAMTDAPKSNRHYYYDIKYRRFFYLKYPSSPDGGIEILDAHSVAMHGKEYHDIFVRLVNLNDAKDEIIEIYKLEHAQKRDIQWQFLTRFVEPKSHLEYFEAVINQKETDSFVLDKVINAPGSEHLFSLWEKFKLEVIRLYANNFEKTTGIKIDLLS